MNNDAAERDLARLEVLHDDIRALRDEATSTAFAMRDAIAGVPQSMRRSAENLAHYLALRASDHVPLQAELIRTGLSSLARREAHVMPTLDAVERALAAMCGRAADHPRADIAIDDGATLLERHAAELLGPPIPHATRVVVTLPPWGAGDVAFMQSLLDAGMDVGRINASHGDPAQWKANVDALKTAAATRGRRVPISMDLSGPKVRTGSCETGPIMLRAGDTVVLHAGASSTDASRNAEGHATSAARIAVRPRELVEHITPGQRALFDDGNIRARCTAIDRAAKEATCIIEAARTGAWPLKDRKGVNVPDTNLPIRALTDDDLQTLDFAVAHVDFVSMSFVRSAADIADLHQAILSRTRRPIGVVAKIETPQACHALPSILLELMKMPPCGVMLARGDLGVEIGFENLPEAQDEILALAEAAHVPVIWATQVLESMTDHGFPTRGEVTDAADAARADAVMLGIGPYMLDTVRFAEDLLARTKLRRARSRAILAKWNSELGS